MRLRAKAEANSNARQRLFVEEELRTHLGLNHHHIVHSYLHATTDDRIYVEPSKRRPCGPTLRHDRHALSEIQTHDDRYGHGQKPAARRVNGVDAARYRWIDRQIEIFGSYRVDLDVEFERVGDLKTQIDSIAKSVTNGIDHGWRNDGVAFPYGMAIDRHDVLRFSYGYRSRRRIEVRVTS